MCASSLIALLFGRPVFFKDFDATVSHSEPLPLVLRSCTILINEVFIDTTVETTKHC